MNSEYRMLKKGEIVRESDEVYDDDARKWVGVVNSAGKPAPDPRYTSHRLFRRAKEKQDRRERGVADQQTRNVVRLFFGCGPEGNER